MCDQINPLTSIKLENPILGFNSYLNIAPLLAHTTFNASNGYMPVHTRIIHTNL